MRYDTQGLTAEMLMGQHENTEDLYSALFIKPLAISGLEPVGERERADCSAR